MNLLNKFFHKQGELILNKPAFAYAMVFLFAGLPFLTWVSVSIVAFLTLRLGPITGLKALGVSVLSILLSNYLVSSLSLMTLVAIFFTIFPLFFAAWILRITASWNMVAIFLVLLTSITVIYAHFILPAFLMEEYNTLLNLLNTFQKNGAQLKSWLENKEQVINYILGIQAVFFLLSSLMSLMIARAFQAKLFYPAGFKQEMLHFQASMFMLLPFALLLVGFYYHVSLSFSLLPTWILYFCAAGMSVLICLFAAHRSLLVFSLLIIAVSMLPLFIFPLVVSIGVLDSFLNFRQRFKKHKSGADSS